VAANFVSEPIAGQMNASLIDATRGVSESS